MRTETAKSHVLQFGQLSLTTEPIGNFEAGNVNGQKKNWFDKLSNVGKKIWKQASKINEVKSSRKNEFAVDSRDINLHYLYNLVITEPTQENTLALQAELTMRMETAKRFETLFPQHVEAVNNNQTPLPTEFDCYRTLIDTYTEECGAISDYGLKYMKYFVAECEGMKNFPSAVDGTVHAIKSACKQ